MRELRTREAEGEAEEMALRAAWRKRDLCWASVRQKRWHGREGVVYAYMVCDVSKRKNKSNCGMNWSGGASRKMLARAAKDRWVRVRGFGQYGTVCAVQALPTASAFLRQVVGPKLDRVTLHSDCI